MYEYTPFGEETKNSNTKTVVVNTAVLGLAKEAYKHINLIETAANSSMLEM